MIQWPDGTSQEGWLRAPEGMAYCVAVAAEVAIRLTRGDASRGADTRGHEAAGASDARATEIPGLGPCLTTHPLVANSGDPAEVSPLSGSRPRAMSVMGSGY